MCSYITSLIRAHKNLLSNSYNKFIGNRKQLPNSLTESVRIYCWGPLKHLTGKHIALEVVRNGKAYYVSFSPCTISELPNQSLFHLRQGIRGEFKNSFDDELLIQGYRKAHIDNQKIQILGNDAILSFISELSVEDQNRLRELGNPAQIAELHSLDLDEMIVEINRLKNADEILWGAWAGSILHQERTYNCASIILCVLYKGGLERLVSTYHDVLGVIGGILFGFISYWNNMALFAIIINLIKGIFLGRFIGGAYEGWTEIQSVFDLSAMEGKGNKFQTVLLRLVSAICSAVVALLKTGAFIPELFNTTPQLVMDMMQKAQRAESALYLHQEFKESTS